MKSILCVNDKGIENNNENEDHDQTTSLGDNQNTNLYQHFRNFARPLYRCLSWCTSEKTMLVTLKDEVDKYKTLQNVLINSAQECIPNCGITTKEAEDIRDFGSDGSAT